MEFIHHLNLGLGLCFPSFLSLKTVFLKMLSLMISRIELISYDVNDSMDLVSYLGAQHFCIVENTYTSCLKQHVNITEKKA